jgi:hypothetical protein
MRKVKLFLEFVSGNTKSEFLTDLTYDEISKKLNSLSESYNNRLRFFKVGSNPEGYKIRL